MKITTNNNVMNNYADLRIHTKDNSTPSAVSNDGHNFDAVIIKSDPRQIEERTFAKDVSRRLSSEIKDTDALPILPHRQISFIIFRSRSPQKRIMLMPMP